MHCRYSRGVEADGPRALLNPLPVCMRQGHFIILAHQGATE